jgi:hypothetical protein
VNSHSNRELLITVAGRLKEVLSELVFLGGCTTGLLITDPAAAPIRVTNDVDVVVQVAGYGDYARFSKRLRALGFHEDSTEGAPICRWILEGMKLDVMPTDEKILGFSNRWYKSAVRNARTVVIEDLKLRVVTAPYFFGTKLEAFRGRGNGDFYSSSDLEDIVTVIDGHSSIVEEVAAPPADLRNYIGGQVATLLNDADFLNALPGQLQRDEMSQARLPTILRKLKALSSLESKQREYQCRENSIE